MLYKKSFVMHLGIFLIMFLFCSAMASMKRIYKFKDVQIPYDLKHKNSIFEKGKYDFEIMFSYTQQVWYLRLIKKGKALCLIAGERLPYKSFGRERIKDPEIPIQPRLNILKNPADKTVNVIFESGKKITTYKLVRVRFKMEY
ncbi:MAG: hypothetical protein GTO16_02490 [Candidatus Aminicenantes bacterium]|nr:hypothetical protein [Candidatus Aminicenantes bacterium]